MHSLFVIADHSLLVLSKKLKYATYQLIYPQYLQFVVSWGLSPSWTKYIYISLFLLEYIQVMTLCNVTI